MKPKFSLPGEMWKKVKGFWGYRVSNLGRVASRRVIGRGNSEKLGPWKLMCPCPNSDGYLFVCLSRRVNGRCTYRRVKVHILVLLAFVGPRPKGMQCRHFPDRDRTNNNVLNLSWGTRKQNMADKVVHGTACCGVKVNTAKMDEDKVRKARRLFKPWSRKYGVAALARRFRISEGTMRWVLQRKIWKHVSCIGLVSMAF